MTKSSSPVPPLTASQYPDVMNVAVVDAAYSTVTVTMSGRT
jgi:hypothetical protein